jgi:SulP family sulfate permease
MLNIRNEMRTYLPFLDWLIHYRKEYLISDIVAGLVTAIMLIPQSMAYAQLAGLPPQIGLYASILPLIVYALLGTSGQLSVGPVAITSLAVFAGVSKLSDPGSPLYLEYVFLLAFIVGVIKILLGIFRIGFVMNFVSHPVLSAFMSASALIIAFGQMKYLLGYQIEGDKVHEIILSMIRNIEKINPATFVIGTFSIFLLVVFRSKVREILFRHTDLPASVVTLIVSGSPLMVVLLGVLVTWSGHLDETEDVRIVGAIPTGLPRVTFPTLDAEKGISLMPTVLTIVFVSVVESIAVAKALASKRRKAIDSNQELIALGAANIAASFTSGYPVTGGFARSVVNDQAGAITGLASIITACAIALIVMWFTPFFYYLPQAVLAATVIVAVLSLFKPNEVFRIWKVNKTDAVVWMVTFLFVLFEGIEIGIMAGVVLSLILFLWRTSRPHIAIVGRVGQSEHFRNILRHRVKTCPEILAVRIDESLYFANTRYLEDFLLRMISDRPEVKHLILICSAINFIDASALETLESLILELRSAGVEFYMAEIKGPVMDELKRAGFIEFIGSERIFLSTHEAMNALGCS